LPGTMGTPSSGASCLTTTRTRHAEAVLPPRAVPACRRCRADKHFYRTSRSFRPNLDTEDAVIIGNGNVAVDCARVLRFGRGFRCEMAMASTVACCASAFAFTASAGFEKAPPLRGFEHSTLASAAFTGSGGHVTSACPAGLSAGAAATCVESTLPAAMPAAQLPCQVKLPAK